jgi:hypothetical protein
MSFADTISLPMQTLADFDGNLYQVAHLRDIYMRKAGRQDGNPAWRILGSSSGHHHHPRAYDTSRPKSNANLPGQSLHGILQCPPEMFM